MRLRGLVAVTAGASWVMAAGAAPAAFDGTWKADAASMKLPSKPDVYTLRNGAFACLSCIPVYGVPADGEFHPVAKVPYFDMVALKVIDDRSIEEIDRKGGKTVVDFKTTVAPDGKTAVYRFTNDVYGGTITGTADARRVTAAVAGSHAAAGAWRTTRYVSVSDNAVTETLKIDGDRLSVSTSLGVSFSATLGGGDAPYHGDPGVTSVAVKRIGRGTIEETDKLDGKAVGVVRRTPAANGTTMAVSYRDP